MSSWSLRGILPPNRLRVCLRCRLQLIAISTQPQQRQQHNAAINPAVTDTGLAEPALQIVEDQISKESSSSNSKSKPIKKSQRPSREKRIKLKDLQSPPIYSSANDEAEKVQRSLHEKFTIQRRKDRQSAQKPAPADLPHTDTRTKGQNRIEVEGKPLRKILSKTVQKVIKEAQKTSTSLDDLPRISKTGSNTLKVGKVKPKDDADLKESLEKELKTLSKALKASGGDRENQRKERSNIVDTVKTIKSKDKKSKDNKPVSKKSRRLKSSSRRPRLRKVASRRKTPVRKCLSDSPLPRPLESRGSVAETRSSRPARSRLINPLAVDSGSRIEEIKAYDLHLSALEVKQPSVPSLSYGLERVLFNPGVYHLQDPRSRVYNFDPYLQNIMPATDFDFKALKQYITSSRDEALESLAKQQGKRYVGSSSSMTSALAHFHFLLSHWRPVSTGMLSRDFPDKDVVSFTALQRSPSAIFLRWRNGSYAIDADKQFDSASILMFLGRSMEKLLTMDTEKFERYRRSSSDKVSLEERKAPESYHYSTMEDFLLRSQLDAYDPRLPGSGMFDLKTRAVVSVRMDSRNYAESAGYQIKSRQGAWESFEREYFDMIRAAFLKYSLQVRMGRMDGIFVAFHNTERIFGFQYISLPELDSTLHGQSDTTIGDQEFKLSISLLNRVLDKAIQKYPDTSIRLHFETREAQTPFMYIFAEPVTEDQIMEIQTRNNDKVRKLEQEILDLDGADLDTNDNEGQDWAQLQANVEEAMDEDIRDPNHEDGIHRHIGVDVPLHVDRLYSGKATKESIEHFDGLATEVSDSKENLDTTDNKAERATLYLTTNNLHDEDAEVGDGMQGNAEMQEGEKTKAASTDSSATRATEAGQESVNEDLGSVAEDIEAAQREAEGTGEWSSDLESSAIGSALTSQDRENETSSRENSSTHADNSRLESVSGKPSSEPTSLRPEVLAMTLTIRNKVNGSYVRRPIELDGKDLWSIEYSLEEVSKPERAWSLYQACQTRRKKKLEENDKRSEEDDAANNYVQNLRRMSKKGAEWRKQMDERDKGIPLKVLGLE